MPCKGEVFLAGVGYQFLDFSLDSHEHDNWDPIYFPHRMSQDRQDYFCTKACNFR